MKAAEEAAGGFRLELQSFPCGASYWLKEGKKQKEWPDETFAACEHADAVLFGAVGLPEAIKSDGTPVGGDVVFGLRFGLDLYANVRPVKLFKGVSGVVADKKYGSIDFVLVRENTEGLYVPVGGFLQRSGERELAVDVRVITRKGAERVIRYAFDLCKKRNGAPADAKHRVTCVDKSNVLKGCILFRAVFKEIAKKHVGVESDYAYVDAFAHWVLQKPDFYDVVVTTNMFGDILSELGATLQGGLGMAPAANIGENHAMFEPVHGSAPALAGKKQANPIAAILAAKMMLEWLAQRRGDQTLGKAAAKIERAVTEVLADGKTRTRDLGGKASTLQMGEAIANAVKTV